MGDGLSSRCLNSFDFFNSLNSIKILYFACAFPTIVNENAASSTLIAISRIYLPEIHICDDFIFLYVIIICPRNNSLKLEFVSSNVYDSILVFTFTYKILKTTWSRLIIL